jgi:hypothetical protein
LRTKEEKVVSLLRSFSKYELNRFRKFLSSPYFNENEELVSWFDALDKQLRQVNGALDKEKLWTSVQGKCPFNQTKYRRLCSDLTQLGYRFLSLEWHERDSLSSQEGLLKRVNAGTLGKHYATALRNIRRTLDDGALRDSTYFYYKYISEYESHLHLERSNAKRSTLDNLQAADRYLDAYYIINKLKHYCDSQNYKSILSIEVEVRLLPNLLRFVEENGYLEIPAVDIYYSISKTLSEPDNPKYYYHLLELLGEHYLAFPPAELRTLYVYATNYCIQQINRGNKDFYRELYDLYFTLLDRRTIFNQEGELDERHYKNVITLGLRLGDYDGVEDFIMQYSPLLKKEFRDNALTFNLAQLHYAKGDYGKVIGLLRYVEYKDVFYALGGKTLLLKTYYELDEHTAMDAHIDSFRIYLRRNKLISGSVKQQYTNFLRLTKKLMFLPPRSREDAAALEQQVLSTDVFVNKNWLLEKLEGLGGGVH